MWRCTQVLATDINSVTVQTEGKFFYLPDQSQVPTFTPRWSEEGRVKCLSQGHNVGGTAGIELGTSRSRVERSTCTNYATCNAKRLIPTQAMTSYVHIWSVKA